MMLKIGKGEGEGEKEDCAVLFSDGFGRFGYGFRFFRGVCR